MKRILLIILLCCLGQWLLAQTAQPWLERRVSISVKEKELEAVLKSLEHDLEGMAFAYLPGSFDVTKKVTVKLDSVPLREVLEQLFEKQEMECTEMRGKIFLKKKKPRPGEGSGQSPSIRRKRTVQVRQHAGETIGTEEAVGGDQTTAGSGSGNSEGQRNQSQAAGTETQNDDQKPTSEAQQKGTGVSVTGSAVPTIENDKPFTDSANLQQAFSDSLLLLSRSQSVVPEMLQVKWSGKPWSDQSIFGDPYIPPLPMEFAEAKAKKPFLYWLQWPTFLRNDTDQPASDKAGVSVNKPEEANRRGIRGYLATGVGVSPLGNENGVKIGGRAVWQMKSSFGLGVAGYGLIGSSMSIAGETERFRIAGGYGGFHIEHTVRPDKPLHLSFPIFVGIGEVTYVSALGGNPLPDITEDGTQVIMVLEPGAMLEMNVFSFLRLGLNATYRYTTNSEIIHSNGDQLLSPTDMNGISVGITVKVGRF